jgi:hypothetical protein
MTPDQVANWLDNETGYVCPTLVPLETDAERNARLIARANTQPIPPGLVPVVAITGQTVFDGDTQ